MADGPPVASPSVTAVELVGGLRAIAAQGLVAGEPRDQTLLKMLNYVRFARPNLSPTYARGYVRTVYDAVAIQPTSVWSEIVNDPVGSWAEGVGMIFGEGWTGLVKRIAVGAVGLILVVLGLMMIGGEATLSAAAARFGKAIGDKVRA